MKTSVVIFISISLLAFAAQAQVSFIPKAGVAFSNIAFDEKEKEQKPKMGVVAGLGVNLPLIENFLSIQPELLYIQKGYKAEFNIRSINPTDPILGTNVYTTTTTLNYLELPVLAKISFWGETVKAYVNAGPSLGFCLNGKVKLEGDGANSETDIKFGQNFDFDKTFGVDNRFEVGAQFGGGIGLNAGPGDLVLDVRYGLGFSNIYKSGDHISKKEATSKHRVFAITVGYAVPLGGK